MLLSAAVAVGALAAVTACSSGAEFAGSWSSMAPSDITAKIPGAADATSLLVIDFADGSDAGFVSVTSNFTVTKLRDGGKVDAKGKAVIDGKWTYDVDDADDVLLDLNYSTLKVSVDDVTVSDSPAARLTKAEIDSVKAAVAESCRHEMSVAMSSEMRRFSVIKDIEVSKDRRTLSFEIESPETDLRFSRVTE
ncbi:MAG: hypothetical protein Q4C34_08260 [Bacteroidales bacterium]|nr:hypothetical protein [Bacteroidales bacterium]